MVDLDLSPEEREQLLEQNYANLVGGRGCDVLGTAPQLARVALRHAEAEGGAVGHRAFQGSRKSRGKLKCPFSKPKKSALTQLIVIFRQFILHFNPIFWNFR